ncbi:MAG TPA: SDR family oxidoreductase [Candidatus Avoscillospira stercorigallinarum]|uniref:SDR family oxidoreductase n=1 Tax=Candidatus Avoscillospira stercorigallinarum TaxID=2840708 RepID=A0A9D1CNT0_9FIRM|nr:SDR family oxidoreductase [Candidatus Avoscillospira stercorigallinarum]
MSIDMSKYQEIAKRNIHNRPAGVGRLAGKICIVTGAAQGFGKGIAEELHKEGATIVIADMNVPLAEQVAAELGERACAIAVNVADEESVANLVGQTVEKYGGLDLMLSNAGVVRSGPIAQMEKKDFDFVTNVNYTGFFLCAKYAAIIMQAQHEADPEAMFDIVTLNSKSGLEGSNKNFAYAGSKFGGIGLTQSFALELCAYNIKVNAVCPGNFLDGPLWSDPERGLFVQYLQAGKVPGAKTVEDVRRYYEAKVPMNRGCLPLDVARAVMYCVEQKYETGQAIPVTGGQVMLN